MAVLLCDMSSSAEQWEVALRKELSEFEIRAYPEIGDPKSIEYAVVWAPPLDLLTSLPNLKLIASLGAGIDHLPPKTGLPHGVPVVRLLDPAVALRMSQYVLAQALMVHRRDFLYIRQQQAKIWQRQEIRDSTNREIGILGLGNIGIPTAEVLKKNGFRVSGWSKTKKNLDGISCYSGDDGLEQLLKTSEILVCLLSLNPGTEGILNRSTFSKLPRGAAIINVARGKHLIDRDLIDALESGHLTFAVLDVFRTEPLPPDHPFWTHPQILVTPHIAAVSDPGQAASIVAGNIRRARDGRLLLGAVDFT